MLDYKLTANETAKLEIYQRAEMAFYDGVQEYQQDATDKEAEDVRRHCEKHLDSMHKRFNIAGIYAKMQKIAGGTQYK